MRRELAKILSDLIKVKGLSQAQVARDLGYTRQRLNQLVKGTDRASSEAIENAINKLGYEVQTVTVSKAEQVH